MTMKTVDQRLNEGRSYRNLASFERRDKLVEGYATTFDDPYVLWSDEEYTIREQVDPHAFDECDMSDVIMQYDHQGRVFARTSNGTLTLRTDDRGLHIEADLNGTEIGRQLLEEIAGGYTNKMSFGFRVEEDKRETVEEEGHTTILRTITKISKLYDVSAVSLPANDATSISARAFGEGVIAEAVEERHARELRERQKKAIKILLEVQK
jgi:hypothetical protein